MNWHRSSVIGWEEQWVGIPVSNGSLTLTTHSKLERSICNYFVSHFLHSLVKQGTALDSLSSPTIVAYGHKSQFLFAFSGTSLLFCVVTSWGATFPSLRFQQPRVNQWRGNSRALLNWPSFAFTRRATSTQNVRKFQC